MHTMIQDVPVSDVQADEMWSFIGKKERRKTFDDDDTLGDSYCWVAIEARTKLVLTFVVGKRSSRDAIEFTRKFRLATSATKRFQLTTDGLQAYIPAVDLNLSDRCDFAQLIKIYASPREGEQRYSHGEVVEAVPLIISGNPNPNRICTSHVERQNLIMRMQIRRLPRLTNASAKSTKATRLLLRCTSRITTSSNFTRRYASLPQWKQRLRIACGLLLNYLRTIKNERGKL
jgi:IS1 family transposase